MGEAKTQITDVDPADFIASVEPERKREEAKLLDAATRDTAAFVLLAGPTVRGKLTKRARA